MEENIKGWFTTDNGTHVPIKEGQSKGEALNEFFNNDVYETYVKSRKLNKEMGGDKYDNSIIKKKDTYALSDLGLTADELRFIGGANDYKTEGGDGENFLSIDEIRKNVSNNKSRFENNVKRHEEYKKEINEQYANIKKQETETLKDFAKAGINKKQAESLLKAEREYNSPERKTFAMEAQQRITTEGGYNANNTMSNRATTAMMNNRYPAEMAAKYLGVSKESIEENLEPSEWHHMGKEATPTNFYDINDFLYLAENATEWNNNNLFNENEQENIKKYRKMLDMSEL